MDAIKTNKLTKYYGKSRGIVNLDLSVEEGAFFGFIGPNGAGKSTTIRTLLGLISPTSGGAEIFGKEVKKVNAAGAASGMLQVLNDTGYLPSEAIFYSGMKVRDIIKLSADLRKKDCSDEARKLCERLELDTSSKVDELSFGNRKKVAIVCALQSNPKLLILDEPTGGLDPLMQHEFFDILRERNKEGATVFLSSHILSEIQRNCTRAAVIREGEIIACGSVEELARTNAKRVSVYANQTANKIANLPSIVGLDGIKDLSVSEKSMSFLYNGDINELIQKLSKASIGDLSISDPDLEEIFLHYYEKAGDGA
ncbi:MAG: ABC transporter ATP-binding protein [Firmicutes bacterium]|nr:ABC transporter ATP-binding protein [Bacillota bacterium]